MSIFDTNNKVTGSFAKFEKFGDQVEGTLVDKRQTQDKMNPGKMQWIYELKGTNGEIILVGGKPGIDMQMKNVRLGQVIGMRYEKDKPSANPALRPAKIVQVYANINVVDEQWIKDREVEGALEPVEDIEAAPSASNPVEEALDLFDSPIEQLEKIYTLADIKFGIKDQEAAQKKVMEATGLPFLEGNFEEILTKLKDIK